MSAFVVALFSCKEEDNAGDLGGSLGKLEIAAVTGTSAEAVCLTGFADGVLTPSNCGFSYAVDGEEAEAPAEVRPYAIDGGLMRGRLSGLRSETTYRVTAFVDLGSVRLTSLEALFTTSAAGTPLPSVPETELQFDSATDGWPSSYTNGTVTLAGHDFAAGDVAVFGGSTYVQFKRSSGYLANMEDMGPIRRVEVVYASGDANLQLYLGDQARPQAGSSALSLRSASEGTQIVPEQVDGAWVFDCSAYDYPFFALVNGDGVSRVGSLRVVCGGAGEAPAPVDKPEFGAPASSGVTENSADVSCSFRYAGSGAVSEVYFSYAADGAASRRADVTTAPGTKTARLSGLEAATRYTFRLCAVVDGALYVSSDASFTTSGGQGGAVTGDTKHPGWPELVPEDAAKANSEYYYAYHLCPDFKVNGHYARNYTVCFSATHHCPVWVAAPRHACYEKGSGRTDAYAKDPDIPANIQYSSKETGGGCNKGHMLGSHERETTNAVNRQVFYYSNIAPQYSGGYNTGGGGWNTLEDWIDGKVCADTTYLVIGTYFDAYTDGYGKSAKPKKISFGGRSDVSCPTMFYIAVLRTKRGNTGKSVIDCTSGELMCAAFVRAHNEQLKGQQVTAKEMMSIADLEKLTGHRFFVNVPNAPKNSYTPSDWGL